MLHGLFGSNPAPTPNINYQNYKIMDKYKKALERARKSLEDGTISNGTINYIMSIFPELQEWENNRIFIQILDAIKQMRPKLTLREYTNCIDWLEKHKECEQKSTLVYINVQSKIRFVKAIKGKLGLNLFESKQIADEIIPTANGCNVFDIQKYGWDEDTFESICEDCAAEYRWLNVKTNNLIEEIMRRRTLYFNELGKTVNVTEKLSISGRAAALEELIAFISQ